METDWRTRFLGGLAVVVSILVSYSLVFRWGMATFEDEPISFFQAMQVVVESITTAGFGGFAPWSSPEMNLLVMAMNLTGVVLVFLGLPAFFVPLIRDVLERTAPTNSTLTNHVIICSYSRRDEVLRKELEAADIPYVFIESDKELVMDLNERGIKAIAGDAERVESLRAANAEVARAVVADVNDETNPTIILSAKRINPDLQVISVVNDHETASYHQYAGADDVVQARQILGEGLAMRASESLANEFRSAIEVDTELEVTEILVQDDSPLVGTTLKDTSIFDDMSVTVIGGWFEGKLVVPPDPSLTIDENTILLVAGHHERADLERLNTRALPTHDSESSRVVVCGYGAVGKNTVEKLDEKEFDSTVIDRQSLDGVDVVGDVTSPGTLLKADIRDARAVVLALNNDTASVYTSLVIERLAPDVEVIARANDPNHLWKLYGAGADFALSLSTMTGEILASRLIDDREILTAGTNFDFLRTSAPALTGKSLAEANIRAETGCGVVAVERDGSLLTDLRGDFVIDDGDVLIVAGSEESIEAAQPFFEG